MCSVSVMPSPSVHSVQILSAHRRSQSNFVLCSRRQSRVYFVYSPCMSCRSPLSALSIAFSYYLNIGSSEPPCIDLEDCLDLAIRKGKAVGETKPTESNRAIKPLPVSIASSRIFSNFPLISPPVFPLLFNFFTFPSVFSQNLL